MHALLRSQDLTKTYGTKDNPFHALKSASFTVNERESVAITGESGSGKSTLLHILGLLDRPDSGSIDYAGDRISSTSSKRQDSVRNSDFGFVFQQFHLDDRATVLENVALPMMIAKTKKADRRGRATEVLERLGLHDKIDSRASQLSGGQRQRVAIARALINRPRIVFADEPTGALDSENSQIVSDLLFELNENDGITLVLVTHSDRLADRCSRKVNIVDGQLQSTHAQQTEGTR
ncbi:ABC transporter ATP-binding protein [Nesterenkonia populi]